MPPEDKALAATLNILGEKLPDEVLAACLPETSPGLARDHLHTAARYFFSEETPPTGEDPRHKPLHIHEKLGKESGVCSLFTDGAARGNPGEGGAGAVLLNSRETEIFAGGAYLGQCTNNVAEYRALLLGLKQASRLGCENIIVHLDSELVVRQIQGIYKVKNAKLKPLFAQAKELLGRFRTCQVRHIRREKNSRADQLANEAIDKNLKP